MLKVGDRIQIRTDIKEGYDENIHESMLQYAGKYTTIKSVYRTRGYHLEIDNGIWFWEKQYVIPNGFVFKL